MLSISIYRLAEKYLLNERKPIIVLVKLLALMILIIPLLDLFLLHSLKDKYKHRVALAFYCTTFVVSFYLFIVKNETAPAFTVCCVVSCVVSIGVHKIYNYLLNRILVVLIEEISGAEVISSLFVTRNEVYALTSRGFIAVQYNEEKYMLYEKHDEMPDRLKAVFFSLRPIRKHTESPFGRFE